jgi:hypothetical protein
MGCPWKAASFFVISAWRSPMLLLCQWTLPSSRTRLTPLGTVSRVGLPEVPEGLVVERMHSKE